MSRPKAGPRLQLCSILAKYNVALATTASTHSTITSNAKHCAREDEAKRHTPGGYRYLWCQQVRKSDAFEINYSAVAKGSSYLGFASEVSVTLVVEVDLV